MTQADSVHSTSPTNTSANNIIDPSRRGFLAQAAVVAAGGVAQRSPPESRAACAAPDTIRLFYVLSSVLSSLSAEAPVPIMTSGA